MDTNLVAKVKQTLCLNWMQTNHAYTCSTLHPHPPMAYFEPGIPW